LKYGISEARAPDFLWRLHGRDVLVAGELRAVGNSTHPEGSDAVRQHQEKVSVVSIRTPVKARRLHPFARFGHQAVSIHAP